MARCLITTSNESSWPDRSTPVLFLGEWCRLYARRKEWSQRDIVVVPYHWDDRELLFQDYRRLANLHETLLGELTITLNELHGVDYSQRYWRILIGPWLGYFVQMLYDRWAMVRVVIRDYRVSSVRLQQVNERDLIPTDMTGFHDLFLADLWNEAVYGQLLERSDIPIERPSSGGQKLIPNSGSTVSSFSGKMRRAMSSTANWASGLCSRGRESFIIGSSLPLRQSLLLQLGMGQIPKIWRSRPVAPVSVDATMRQWGTTLPQISENFSDVARSLIPRHMPTAYIEGYRNLDAAAQSLPWPKSPPVIFTNHSFVSDDLFKVWAAKKVEEGSKLVTGQQGGNYGMARWNFLEDHQIAISDRYLTWGWTNSAEPKVKPVGNLKGFGVTQRWDAKGSALMVEMGMPRTSYHMYAIPVARQWLDYFEDQIRFVEALAPELRDQLRVRLYSQDYGWSQTERWQNRFPSVELDDGSQPMSALLSHTRLYIATYNATTYLESLSLNIPTLMFWNPRHWELREGAKPAFDALEEAGVFHQTPESAARKMTEIWSDVWSWWKQESVQSVRRSVCEQYAHVPANPRKARAKLHRSILEASGP